MPRRVGYIRVSTASGEQLSALENQRERVAASGVDEVIQDVQSGRESDREGLIRLLDLINRRQVEEVVFTRVDRLGRDAADTDAVIAFAAKRSVRLTALDGGTVESETPAGFVMSRIMTTMAEAESRMLSQRIKAGFAGRRKRHEPYNGRAPWGYRMNGAKTAYEPDPIEWPRAQEFIAILADCGWRMNTALDERLRRHPGTDIPLHSCRAVRCWLLNPVLRGGIGYKQVKNHRFEEIVWGRHEALISHEKFSHLESVLDQNRRMWGHNSERKPRLITSLCVCGLCKRRMTYAGTRTIPAVICRTRGCPQQYKCIHEETVAQAINQALAARAKDLASMRVTEPIEAKALRQRIRRAEALNDPAFESTIEELRQQLKYLLAGPQKAAPAVRLESLSDPNAFLHATPEELRELYAKCVSRVVVTNQEVAEVVLRF